MLLSKLDFIYLKELYQLTPKLSYATTADSHHNSVTNKAGLQQGRES